MLGNAVLDEETNKKSIFISDLVTVSWLNEDEALLENNGLSWEHPWFELRTSIFHFHDKIDHYSISWHFSAELGKPAP